MKCCISFLSFVGMFLQSSHYITNLFCLKCLIFTLSLIKHLKYVQNVQKHRYGLRCKAASGLHKILVKKKCMKQLRKVL